MRKKSFDTSSSLKARYKISKPFKLRMTRPNLFFRVFNKKKVDFGLLCLLPGLIGFVIFFIWPFIISMGYSFVDKPIDSSFVGFNNYLDLFKNDSYIRSLKNTLIFIGICVPLNIVLSLVVAFMINKVTRYKEIFILIFLIPLVIPSGSMNFFWKALFVTDGYLNYLLSFFGVAEINWLESQITRYVIVSIFIWKNLGYNIVLFVSGINNIPKLYYEAATVDGAGSIKSFFDITLSNLIPTFVLVTIMSVINSFKVFKEIYLLTGSYPHESIYMLQHFMNNMFYSLNYPKLTTATSILVIIITILSQALLKYERRKSG